jgi:hypothetical protein
MPRDETRSSSATLIGKLGALRIKCAKCGRSGKCRLAVLIAKYGRDEKCSRGWMRLPPTVRVSWRATRTIPAARSVPISRRYCNGPLD